MIFTVCYFFQGNQPQCRCSLQLLLRVYRSCFRSYTRHSRHLHQLWCSLPSPSPLTSSGTCMYFNTFAVSLSSNLHTTHCVVVVYVIMQYSPPSSWVLSVYLTPDPLPSPLSGRAPSATSIRGQRTHPVSLPYLTLTGTAYFCSQSHGEH